METSGIVSGVATLEYDAESICLLKCPVKYEAQTVFFFFVSVMGRRDRV